MRDSIEIFDEAALTWGLGSSCDHVAKNEAAYLFKYRIRGSSCADHLRSQPSAARMPPVRVDFVMSGEVNGVADIRDELALVGITRGAALLLTDLFYRILSHPRALVNVGRASAESAGNLISNKFYKNWDNVLSEPTNKAPPSLFRLPLDPLRSEYALRLAFYAFDFLIIHELGHIWKGHVGFVRAKAGSPFILEMASGMTAGLSYNLDRQSLEMDADLLATDVGLLAALGRAMPGYGDAIVFSQPNEVIFAWAFAIAGLFYIWGLNIDNRRPLKSVHPSTGLRFLYCIQSTAAVVSRFDMALVKNVIPICMAAFREFDRCARLFGGGMSQSEYDDFIRGLSNARSFEHLRLIRDNVRRLQSSLATHDFIDRPVPDRPPLNWNAIEKQLGETT